MMLNKLKYETPIYRAERVGQGLYEIGFLINTNSDANECTLENEDGVWICDISTLAIHFHGMFSCSGIKIFASLGKDGIGGDVVEGKCRDCNGDTLQMMHRPVTFNGVVRFYSETVMGVVVETEDEIYIPCEHCKPLVMKRGDALRWSDCRQNIKAIGIKK